MYTIIFSFLRYVKHRYDFYFYCSSHSSTTWVWNTHLAFIIWSLLYFFLFQKYKNFSVHCHLSLMVFIFLFFLLFLFNVWTKLKTGTKYAAVARLRNSSKTEIKSTFTSEKLWFMLMSFSSCSQTLLKAYMFLFDFMSEVWC